MAPGTEAWLCGHQDHGKTGSGPLARPQKHGGRAEQHSPLARAELAPTQRRPGPSVALITPSRKGLGPGSLQGHFLALQHVVFIQSLFPLHKNRALKKVSQSWSRPNWITRAACNLRKDCWFLPFPYPSKDYLFSAKEKADCSVADW